VIQHAVIPENIVVPDILLKEKLNTSSAGRGPGFMPTLLLLSVLLPPTALCSGPDILGLQLGMKQSEVLELFSKSGVLLSEIDSQHLSAPRPLAALEAVREVRLSFERDELRKITVFFEIPPYQPTAANLIQIYERENERLKQVFGPPAKETVDMQAPTPEERHQWLTRGRGYYLSSWVVENQLKVTLWLYGEDYGIVLMEIYESLEK
jgi:hypothetical protein